MSANVLGSGDFAFDEVEAAVQDVLGARGGMHDVLAIAEGRCVASWFPPPHPPPPPLFPHPPQFPPHGMRDHSCNEHTQHHAFGMHSVLSQVNVGCRPLPLWQVTSSH